MGISAPVGLEFCHMFQNPPLPQRPSLYGELPHAALEVLTCLYAMLHPPSSALLLSLISRVNPLWPMHFPRSWHIATES